MKFKKILHTKTNEVHVELLERFEELYSDDELWETWTSPKGVMALYEVKDATEEEFDAYVNGETVIF